MSAEQLAIEDMLDCRIYSWEKQCSICDQIKMYVYFSKTGYYLQPPLTPAQFTNQCRACAKSDYSKHPDELKAQYYFRRTSFWDVCLNYWGHSCCICGRSEDDGIKLAVDHWQPYANGHSLSMLNILPLCQGKDGCNNSKRNRDTQIWLLYRLGENAATEKRKRIESYFSWVLEQESANFFRNMLV